MRKISLKQLNWVLVTFVSLIYLWTVLKYSVNMPYWDDYGAVLDFLNNFVVANVKEQIKLLFSQHNEHRIVFNKIIELMQYKLLGEVNFLYLIIIGNVGWFMTLVLLWKYSKKQNITIVAFSPVVLIMLSFVHFELMAWAMASLEQYYQILFSLLAIYFLVNNKLKVAFIFMIVSVFTGGGGVVLAPIFLLYAISSKNLKHIFLTLIVSISILLVYFVFLNYSKPGHHPSIAAVISDPILLITYMLTFIGNIGKTKIISIVIGSILISLFALIGKKMYKKEPFLFWSILFILVTASATGLARAGFGVEQALLSRYSIYSVSLVSLIYLSYMSIFKLRFIYFLGLLFGVLSFIFWFANGIQCLDANSKRLKTELLFPNLEYAESILKKSDELGVFSSWRGIKLSSEILNVSKIEGVNNYCISIGKQLDVCDGNIRKYHNDEASELKLIVSQKTKDITFEGWSVDNISKNSACGVVVLVDKKKNFFKLSSRQDVANFFSNANYEKSGFDGKVDISNLGIGLHTIEIRTINHDCNGYYETLKVPLYIEEVNMDTITKASVVDKNVTGYLDTVNKKILQLPIHKISKTEKELNLAGWFIDEPNKSLVKAVIVEINGKKLIANYGLSRVDVARALKNDIYENSGFDISISINELNLGKNSISLYVLSNKNELIKTNYDFNINVE